MNLIEKKCPNCGASLEFSDTDKSCKCNYCHRAFEIERNNQPENSDLDISQQFVLNEFNEVTKGFKLFHMFFVIMFIIVAAFIGFCFFQVFRGFRDDNIGPFQSGPSYYTEVSELSNDDYEDIDFDARVTIQEGEGEESFSIDGNRKREKVYVAYKDDSSYVIATYKVNYYNFFHKDQRFTVYVPMVYENINKKEFVDKFSNPQIQAPEFYFDSEKKSYTYGYGSMDDVYSNVIKPLEEKNYNITEK